MRVELYDGTPIEFPDGTSPEVIQRTAKRVTFERKAAEANRKQSELSTRGATGGELMAAGVDPTEGNSFFQNAAIGVGKAMYDVGRGAKQIANQGLDFIDPRRSGSRADADRAAFDRVKAQDAPLMSTGGGVVGNIAGNVGAAVLPGMALKGAGAAVNAAGGVRAANALRAAGQATMAPSTVGGAAAMGATLGAVQPTGTDDSRLENVAFGAGAGAVGKVAGDKIARALADKVSPSRLSALQAQNSVKDAAMTAGQSAGYVLPPSQANPSLVNRVLESLPGKAGTQQAASLKNQEVTNKLVKQGLGLPQDAPLTEQALQRLRSEAGKAYAAVKSIPGRINTDQQFATEISSLGNDFAAAAKEFPDLVNNEGVSSLRDALTRPDISPKAAVELIKKLRFDASKNFRSFDDPAKAALAQAQRSAAESLDGLIERSLAATGDAEKSAAYRAARVLIAKAHDVESALNESTGNVSAKVLAKILEKGKPLTGELETVAKFSRAFPTATQNTERLSTVLGGTPLDWVMGAGSATATGNPMMLATALARPAVRAALVSQPYQKLMAGPQSYAPSTSARIAELLARKAQPMLPAAASAGALNLVQ
jgi:hypothetical protein